MVVRFASTQQPWSVMDIDYSAPCRLQPGRSSTADQPHAATHHTLYRAAQRSLSHSLHTHKGLHRHMVEVDAMLDSGSAGKEAWL